MSNTPDILITVKAMIDGFAIDLAFSGTVEQLVNITKRLRDIGATPASLSTAPLGGARKAAVPRVEPVYSTSGDPCCPKHEGTRLREGKFGLYCPAKDDSTDRGYCNLKFAD